MRTVFRTMFLLAVAVLLGLLSTGARGQEAPSPLERELIAAAYTEGVTVKLALAASPHMAEAVGEVSVRRRQGFTEFEVSVEAMQPAILFGGDYNTYVVWAISPEGWVVNSGELILDGAKGKIKATTTLSAFSVLVSAEPHFLVSRPSPFVVLSSTAAGLVQQKGVTSTLFVYSDFAPPYKFERENLVGPAEAKGRMRSDRHQAVIAVRFAEGSGAREWAKEEFEEAREALSATVQAFGLALKEEELATLAHRTVRLAVRAKKLAEERRAAAMLADERETSRSTIERLRSEKARAEETVARQEMEIDDLKSRSAKTGQRLREVEQAMLTANQEADRLARLKSEAERQARAAEDQTAGFYVRVHDSLEQLAEIRETDRGLVVNLPDVMFASGSSRLQPGAKEILSGIAGVLLVAPEYNLSIEGHTDSTGRTAFNQELSQKRAATVRGYLDNRGISPATMSMRGFGESQPLVSNNNEAGRKQNRRVEIIIEGLTR